MSFDRAEYHARIVRPPLERARERWSRITHPPPCAGGARGRGAGEVGSSVTYRSSAWLAAEDLVVAEVCTEGSICRSASTAAEVHEQDECGVKGLSGILSFSIVR